MSGHAEIEVQDRGDDSPFRVVVASLSHSVPELPLLENAEEEISLDDIEAAYMRALETAEQAESQFLEDLPQLREEDAAEEENSPVIENGPPSVIETSCNSLLSDPASVQTDSVEDPIVSSEQVVEALLFVGGAPLPAKKFLDVLGGTHSQEQVAAMLESMNARYVAQRRPYEVRLVEGGYRLQLSPEYETVRNRAYGHGPKEVKLAQDALEVLAFVAYQQPVAREALEETGKLNLPGLLRQLLRRELLCVDRSDPEAGECYRTTSRFLELFGLSSLEDLPQAGTFNFK